MFLVGGSRGKNSLSVLPAPSTKGGARGKKGPTGNETSHYPATSGARWNTARLGNVELVSCLLGSWDTDENNAHHDDTECEDSRVLVRYTTYIV